MHEYFWAQDEIELPSSYYAYIQLEFLGNYSQEQGMG